jgi:tetratricopeptide (TPR) repeat protein
MGDSLLRSGERAEATKAYAQALRLLDDVLRGFPDSPVDLNGEALAISPDVAAKAAELWGERGGILRRQSALEDSRASYARGAAFEESYNLAATYNRVNALKLDLMTGRTLSELVDDLVKVRTALEERLATDERAADDAWLWADLGDIRLLLRDVDDAVAAYRTFMAKARTDSPGTTLSVLHEVIDKIEKNGDPDFDVLRAATQRVEDALGV